jgi:hypothetical protein
MCFDGIRDSKRTLLLEFTFREVPGVHDIQQTQLQGLFGRRHTGSGANAMRRPWLSHSSVIVKEKETIKILPKAII